MQFAAMWMGGKKRDRIRSVLEKGKWVDGTETILEANGHSVVECRAVILYA